jgi:hypothetical protein
VELSCNPLEDRVTPSHFAGAHHLAAAVRLHEAVHHAQGTITSQPTAPSTTSTSSSTGVRWGHGTRSSSSAALSTALTTLRKDIQTIELASSTTVGQLTAIRVAFQQLSTDGLTPSSYSALQSFENSLVTTNANAPGSLTGNTTLLGQFEALYTSSPTAQQKTDLNTAYNALAAAVTSAKITSANITTINTDWSAVLAAQNSTSTATFPYFTLVTGQGAGLGRGAIGAC